MPTTTHAKTAEHHEAVAKSHRTAAEPYVKGDTAKSAEHAKEAHGHSGAAHKTSGEAHAKPRRTPSRSRA